MKTRYILILLLFYSCSEKVVTTVTKPESIEYLSRMNKLMYSDIKSTTYINLVNTDCMKYVATAVNQFNISVEFTNELILNSSTTQTIKYIPDSIIKFDSNNQSTKHIDIKPLETFLKRSMYCFNQYYNILKPKFESIENISLDTIYFYTKQREKDEIGIVYEKFRKKLNKKMTLLEGLAFIQEWTNEIIYLELLKLNELKYKTNKFCSQVTLRYKTIEEDSLRLFLDFSYTDTTNQFFVRYSDRSNNLDNVNDQVANTINGIVVSKKIDTIYGTIMCYRYDEIVWSPWQINVK